MSKPSYLNFDYKNYAWKANIDYRLNPELYKIGKGEQGVLICEPYKSEILKYWRFKTPEIAFESSEKIYSLFLKYIKNKDFVGMDMARKFLQMGYTRSRRYANYKGGRKYKKTTLEPLKWGNGDNLKAESARIFFGKWKEAEANLKYAKLKKEWKEKLG